MSRDAVIVSTARTPIGKAYKGAFNATLGPTLGSHSVKEAVKRAGIDGGEVEDDSADLVEAVAGGAGSLLDVVMSGVRASGPLVLGGLQEQVDARQTLRHAVVDLP